jgi:hypothetical protein
VKLDDDNIIPLLGVCDGYYKNNDVSLQKAWPTSLFKNIDEWGTDV